MTRLDKKELEEVLTEIKSIKDKLIKVEAIVKNIIEEDRPAISMKSEYSFQPNT
jgi:hypothetical protein